MISNLLELLNPLGCRFVRRVLKVYFESSTDLHLSGFNSSSKLLFNNESTKNSSILKYSNTIVLLPECNLILFDPIVTQFHQWK